MLGLEAAAGQPEIFLTGQELHTACKSEAGDYDDAACTFYITGIVDGLGMGSLASVARLERIEVAEEADAKSRQALGTCVAEGVTYSQTIMIVQKYLSDHPEDLHKDASLLILKSLRSAFPCI